MLGSCCGVGGGGLPWFNSPYLACKSLHLCSVPQHSPFRAGAPAEVPCPRGRTRVHLGQGSRTFSQRQGTGAETSWAWGSWLSSPELPGRPCVVPVSPGLSLCHSANKAAALPGLCRRRNQGIRCGPCGASLLFVREDVFS